MEKLIAFHGSDHKVGCTMLSQSVAELLADHIRGMKILLIFLNGRKSDEFMAGDITSIDHFKNRIESGVSIDEALVRKCRRKENLYVIGGIQKELEHRQYFPGTAERLLKELENKFDVIIADTGSEIDNGLALGGLLNSARNFMILTQTESSVRRYEETRGLYNKLSVKFDYHVVNKQSDKDPYSLKYLSERLRINKTSILKVAEGRYPKQAESEKKTLLAYHDDGYAEDIAGLASITARDAGIGEFTMQRKQIWKSFI